MNSSNKSPIVVIKFGGSLYEGKSTEKGSDERNPYTGLATSIKGFQELGIGVVLVHGGGKAIDARLKKLHMEGQFHKGYRITGDQEISEIEMLLTGSIRNEMVFQLNQLDVKAVGISGKDGGLIEAKKKEQLFDGTKVDLGWVGEIIKIQPLLIETLLSQGMVPIISPTGWDVEGHTYNINADTVAGKIAEAIGAWKLLLMTDVDGLYEEPSVKQGLVKQITCDELGEWIESGKLDGGMIPKGLSAIEAIQNGVKNAIIFNGNNLEAMNMLLEVHCESIGTSVVLN